MQGPWAYGHLESAPIRRAGDLGAGGLAGALHLMQDLGGPDDPDVRGLAQPGVAVWDV